MNSRSLSEDTPLLPSRSPSSTPQPRLTAIASWVLPLVVVLYFLGYIVAVIELNPYVYNRISSEYKGFNASSNKPCVAHMNESVHNQTGIKIQQEIEKRVSTFELYLGLVTFVLAAFPVIILGPLTDKYGRKVGFIFPIVGTLLKQIIYAAVIGWELPLYCFFFAHLFEALGGGFATMLMTMFSMTADITTLGPQRSFRIAVMEGLQTFTASIGEVCIAIWRSHSFLHPLFFALATSLCALVVVLAVLPETSPGPLSHGAFTATGQRLSTVLKSNLILVKNSLLLYVRDTEGRLVKRRLCMGVFVLTVAVNFAKPGVQTLFLMKYPLCWSALKVDAFGGIQLACHWVVIWALLILLQKIFGMADRHVAIIGCISSLSSSVFMSLATNDVMVYEVAVLSVMIRAIIPMLRSIMSSVVSATQQGSVYSGMACIETLGAGVFSLIANRIYYATLGTWAGAVFLLFAAFMVIALVLLVILNVLISRENRTRVSRQLSVQ